MTSRPATCCGHCRHLVTVYGQDACNVLGLKPAEPLAMDIKSRDAYGAALWPWINAHSVAVTDVCDRQSAKSTDNVDSL